MKIYHVQIPIANYHADGLHFQDLIFDSPPSKEHLLKYLQTQHKHECELVGYCGWAADCIDSLYDCEDWPTINSLTVHANTFTKSENLRKYWTCSKGIPVSITRRDVVRGK